MIKTIIINRAPVLTLWAAVVAERIGYKWDEALTLGQAVAGKTAYSKAEHIKQYGWILPHAVNPRHFSDLQLPSTVARSGKMPISRIELYTLRYTPVTCLQDRWSVL